MAEYTAEVQWSRREAVFTDNRYSREHVWMFDGGVRVPASSSPHVVPVPLSNAANVDPEEAYIAALSSCHMLWFLDIASQEGYVVESYTDKAGGVMAKNAVGQLVMTVVTLRPKVVYTGEVPDRETEQKMHHLAHESCYLANSVRTTIKIVFPS
jgi:organic hydroperoxide reductase OsmC/OhrA